MTNDEVKALLRELARDTQEVGDIRSRTIRIRISDEEETEQPPQEDDQAQGAPENEFEESTEGVERADGAEEDEDDEEDNAQASPKRRRFDAFRKRRARREAQPETEQNSETSEQNSKASEKKIAGASYPVEPTAFESDAWMFRSPEEDPDQVYHRRRLLSTAAARLSGRSEGEPAETVSAEEAEDSDPAQEVKASLRERLSRFLQQKGIGLRELSLIGGGIVLVILLIALALTLLGNRKKRANVTADPGLRITVEKEPAKWCKSGEVALRLRAASPIQSVSIDGRPVTFTGQGRVTVDFEAQSHEVGVMVVCEDQVRSASVVFSKIDAEDPRIDVSFRDGLALLQAEDEVSGVDEVWYGTVDAFSDVPSYTLYTGPFEAEKGRIYTYFATDKAGNVSTPVSTNLTPATAMTLDREEVSLFAGETYALALSATPARAYLNGLHWSSSDEEVALVSDTGVVTAVTDGEAIVKAEAEGIKSVSCIVRVRSEVSVTISAVGDMTLGDDISFSPVNNFSAVYARYGPDYFLSNVREIFDADDITFANLEGTLTDRGERANKQFAFRGDPAYVDILTGGSVEAVTLANNHSYDYGEISHTDTQDCLDQAGVAWCEGDKIIVKDVNGVRMALIGIYVLQDGAAKAEQVESTIAEAKAQGAQLIVVAFHWGTERETKPDATQKTLAHLAIDSGADLVVGHHPHVLQGIEKYAGKYICYSLGNFCFGGNSNPTDKDTMIFQQTFHIMRGGDVQTGGVSVVPCSVSSQSDWNNYQPTPATGAEAERIMEKINALCEPFGTSF